MVNYTRTDYLEHNDVDGYVKYIKELIANNKEFSHQYEFSKKGRLGPKWYENNNKSCKWSIKTIRAAYESYCWVASNGETSFANNKEELDCLSQYLRGEKKYNYSDKEKSIFFSLAKMRHEKKEFFIPKSYSHILKSLNSDEGIESSLSNFMRNLLDASLANACEIELKNDFPNGCKDLDIFIAYMDVLKWGGVLDKGKASVERLFDYESSESGLKGSIKAASKLLNAEDEKQVLDDFGKKGPYLMNSGMTKIYSLFDGRSIIYDGRVGAALGLLARKYLEKTYPEKANIDMGNHPLHFLWGADQGDGEKRNPSTKRIRFEKLPNDSAKHALMNLRANWLIGAVLADIDNLWGIEDSNEQRRALEAALFMVGYDVKCTSRSN